MTQNELNQKLDRIRSAWAEVMLKKIKPDFETMRIGCFGDIFDMARKHLATMNYEQILDISALMVAGGLEQQMDEIAAQKRVDERADETKTTSA